MSSPNPLSEDNKMCSLIFSQDGEKARTLFPSGLHHTNGLLRIEGGSS
jgi:hypothetical protein